MTDRGSADDRQAGDLAPVAWVDTGSGPGYEIQVTREDLDAAAIIERALAGWNSYETGDDE